MDDKQPDKQLNVRVSEEVHRIVVAAKYERRTSLREAVEHAIKETYGGEK